MPLKDLTMERKRVEEFEETLMYRLWVNQSCFSLGFLSQNSLWKLSYICGYKGYLYWSEREMWNVRFYKTGVARGLALRLDWVARSNREITVCLVVLFCPVVLQLAWLFTFQYAWYVCCVWRLEAASHPRGPAASLCFLVHSWAIFTLSHSLPLHQTHLNTGLLNAEIQANLARNKANKMVD